MYKHLQAVLSVFFVYSSFLKGICSYLQLMIM